MERLPQIADSPRSAHLHVAQRCIYMRLESIYITDQFAMYRRASLICKRHIAGETLDEALKRSARTDDTERFDLMMIAVALTAAPRSMRNPPGR